ncbi:MAG: GNAT family N-acetyltransferase [Cryomorphaceae bacterium]
MIKFTQVLNTTIHIRDRFDCGDPSLTKYLKEQANQDFKNKTAVCFVALDSNSDNVIGYYTLSNNSIPRSELNKELQKKLKLRYSTIPTTLLGRLGVDVKRKGKGLGRDLLMDAMHRALAISKHQGSVALVVDPINNSEPFYDKFGFIKLDSSRMFLPMKTIEKLNEGPIK